MQFNHLVHHRSLPSLLNSHQIHDTSTVIHELVSEALIPQLDNPKYQALAGTLGNIELNIARLNVAHNQRRYKDTKEMRGVGSVDGKVGDDKLAVQKLRIYNQRKAIIKRLRQFVELQLALASSPDVSAASTTLNDLMNKRVPRFETKSYAESTSEFRYFIESVETSPEAVAALSTLDLVEPFEQIKSLQAEFNTLRKQHTELDAIREEKPKVVPSARDLRFSVTAMLSFLHFDIETGDDTFRGVLAHIDETIDKELAIARSRKTRARTAQKNKKANTANQANEAASSTVAAGNENGDKAEAGDKAEQAESASEASGVSGASETGETSAPADNVSPPAS